MSYPYPVGKLCSTPDTGRENLRRRMDEFEHLPASQPVSLVSTPPASHITFQNQASAPPGASVDAQGDLLGTLQSKTSGLAVKQFFPQLLRDPSEHVRRFAKWLVLGEGACTLPQHDDPHDQVGYTLTVYKSQI